MTDEPPSDSRQPMYRIEWGFDRDTNEDYVTVDSSAYGWHRLEGSAVEVALGNFVRFLNREASDGR